MDELAEQSRPRRWPWILLVVVLLLVSGVQIYRLILKAQVNHELALLHAQGYPTHAIDLSHWPEDVPDDRNAAKGIVDAADNSFMDNFQINWPSRIEELGPKEREDFLTVVTNNAMAIELLHSALDNKKARFPIAYERGPNALLPHLAKVKSLTILLRAEALIAADQGQTDRAVRALLDSVALARSLDGEPLLISQLVRTACLAITSVSLERVLTQQTLSESQLQTLQQALQAAEEASKGAMTAGLAGETCLGIHFFTVPASELARYLDPQAMGNPGASDTAAPNPAGLVVYGWTGLKDRDFLFYVRMMHQLLDVSTQPFPENVRQARLTAQHLNQLLQKDKLVLISRQLLPSLEKAADKTTDLAARLRCAEVALAVERFRIAHAGALPDDLQKLVPTYLSVVPQDPFDGTPVKFTKLERGYVVYSVGLDGQDDGGVERESSTSNNSRRKGKKNVAPAAIVSRVPSSSTNFDTTFIVER